MQGRATAEALCPPSENDWPKQSASGRRGRRIKLPPRKLRGLMIIRAARPKLLPVATTGRINLLQSGAEGESNFYGFRNISAPHLTAGGRPSGSADQKNRAASFPRRTSIDRLRKLLR
jgi:hypothetical protein